MLNKRVRNALNKARRVPKTKNTPHLIILVILLLLYTNNENH